MAKQTKKPEVIEGDRVSTTYQHDAFGVITVTKPQGHIGHLFGSSMNHQRAVRVEIRRAKLERNLHRDWIFGGDNIVSIMMSEAQWAQFVSSVGCGSGTPVTLDYAPARGTPVETMPGIDGDNDIRKKYAEEVDAEVRKYTGDILRQVEALKSLNSGGAISKKAFAEAVRSLEISLGNLPSNLAFTQRSIEENMEKIVSDAKIEVEACMMDLVTRTGIEALKSQFPQLEDNHDATES